MILNHIIFSFMSLIAHNKTEVVDPMAQNSYES